MDDDVTTLHHRRLTTAALCEFVHTAPSERVQLTDDHRKSLSSRFRGVSAPRHRRLDAWSVEQAGKGGSSFSWTPATARRVLGNGALRRIELHHSLSILDAVRDELADQLMRAASGYARAGSMAHWLASSPHPVLGLVTAEAVNWATQLYEIGQGLPVPWTVPATDAYYEVATARTTLRARRDLIISNDESRIIVRVRAGAPGKSAGPGLRADLTIETLANHDGVAPARFVGLWPEAGVMLCVDGTMDDLRCGARDLVRTAVAQRRQGTLLAA